VRETANASDFQKEELSDEAQADKLSIPVGLAVAAIGMSSAVAGTGGRSATGSGQFEFTSTAGVTALRTFAFEARGSGDGPAVGQAQVDNRAVDQRFHIQIDCLNMIGDIAVMSGTVTSAAGEGVSVGDAAIFAAQDNGEGSNAAPDRATRGFLNSGLVCTDITPANVGLYTNLLTDIEGGNVQLH
jgi:hypothetical protein